MRAPKALVIPLKFREGYPDELVDPLIAKSVDLIKEAGVDGTVTEVVMYDKDADLVADKYNVHNYDFTILLVPTWFEPVTMVRAAKPFFCKPMIVWGYSNFDENGQRTNLGSSAGAGVTKGTLREYGVNHDYIHYSPGIGKDEKIKAQLAKFANVARAMTLMEGSRILCFGYQFGGMTLGDMDLRKMRDIFGVDLIEQDAYSLIERMKNVDTESAEYKENAERIQKLSCGTIAHKLEPVTRMYTALKEFVSESNTQALTLKCHFALSQEYGLTPCIPLSVIGNDIVASCEADIPVTLTQLLLNYLSGGLATAYADTHELTDDRVLWGACGYAPSDMCVDGKITCQLPVENAFGLGATFGDYITNKNWLKAGLLTCARILKDKDGGFTIHTASGEAQGEIGSVAEYGSPQYAFTDMKLNGDMEQFSKHLGSHHYALVYADVAEALEMYCEFKGIRFIKD